MDKGKIFALLVFVILLIAITATLFLLQKQQILKSRASFVPSAVFVNEQGNILSQTSNRNVVLRITKEQAQIEPTPSPSPIPTNTTLQVKMMMIQYIPPGGIAARYPGSEITDTIGFAQNTYIPALNTGTKYHGYSNSSAEPALNFTLAAEDIFTVEGPPPSRPDNYLGAPLAEPGQPGYLDVASIFRNHNICNVAKQKDIKFVVLATSVALDENAPKGFESYITGNKGIPTNGPTLRGSEYCDDKTIQIVGFGFQRGLAEALESYGHHLETIFRHFRPEYILFSDEGNTAGDGRYFPTVRGDSCGTIHNPPNARFEYDRANTADFLSDCRNWKPSGNGAKEALNCNAWGCTSSSWEIWWMQNIPGLNNDLVDSENNRIPNWWVYIGDPDRCYNNPLGCN